MALVPVLPRNAELVCALLIVVVDVVRVVTGALGLAATAGKEGPYPTHTTVKYTKVNTKRKTGATHWVISRQTRTQLPQSTASDL